METQDSSLLITVGDSFTEGAGCYLPELLDENNKPLLPHFDMWQRSLPRAKEFGWPAICSRKLGYDLINLGTSGASNSACAKRLIQEEHTKYKTIYTTVKVVFMISDPFRFSFYIKGNVNSYLLNNNNVKQIQDVVDWYAETSDVTDQILETSFYLRTIEHFCNSCGYEFYWGSAFTDITDILPHYNTSCLHENEFPSFLHYLRRFKDIDTIAHCGHYNELGHELVGKLIADKIIGN